MKRIGLPVISWLVLGALPAVCGAGQGYSAREWVGLIRDRVEHRDYLGARILVRKINDGQWNITNWYIVRGIVARTPELGQDLILHGDRKYLATQGQQVHDNLDAALSEADQLLMSQKWNDAFDRYQKIAQKLQTRIHSDATASVRNGARDLYPYVLHGMARALYSGKRLNDAWEVYSWITPQYPSYRQVLFEKMWTAFRSGRIDTTLGTIASQRSAYFSLYVEPEAYLLQVYLYKLLCRKDDLTRVIQEIGDFKRKVRGEGYTYLDWAQSDLGTRALLELTKSPTDVSTPGVTQSDREYERRSVLAMLENMYVPARKRLIDDLNTIEAYANLAVTPGMDTGLKPIEKLPSRAALFKANLEIWPADSAEEWADEVGHHRFIGESLCGKEK